MNTDYSPMFDVQYLMVIRTFRLQIAMGFLAALALITVFVMLTKLISMFSSHNKIMQMRIMQNHLHLSANLEHFTTCSIHQSFIQENNQDIISSGRGSQGKRVNCIESSFWATILTEQKLQMK